MQQRYSEAFQIALPWADLGFGWAELCVGSCYQTGLGVEQDSSKAIQYFLRAGAKGVGGAWYGLGVIYSVGDGAIAPDEALAELYYGRARDCGYYLGKRFWPDDSKDTG